MIQTLGNAIKTTFDTVNPATVTWNEAGSIAGYAFKVAIILGVIVAIFLLIKNVGKGIDFLKTTYIELKKVTWLNRADTYKFSVITITMIIVSTIFIVLTDQAFLLLRGVLISTGV